MAYDVGQYNQAKITVAEAGGSEDPYLSRYLSGAIMAGTPARYQTSIDTGVTSTDDFGIFYDECIVMDTYFKENTNYYFHAKIHRTSSSQTFSIYLLQNETNNTTEAKMQFLKKITVAGGGTNTWADFEIIFTPIIDSTFNSILFKLQRETSDFVAGETRYPKILYEELYSIKNLVDNFSGIKNNELIKIGIQSYPGMMMCINGEEFHVGRTGVLEIKNGLVSIDFFAPVNGGTSLIGNSDYDDLLLQIDEAATIEGLTGTASECIFDCGASSSVLSGVTRTRSISPFNFDYMYIINDGS